MGDETLEDLENSVLSLCQDDDSMDELTISCPDEDYHELLDDVMALCDSVYVTEDDQKLHGLASWLKTTYTIHVHTNGHHCVPLCKFVRSEGSNIVLPDTADEPCNLIPLKESTPLKPEHPNTRNKVEQTCDAPHFDIKTDDLQPSVPFLDLTVGIENNHVSVDLAKENLHCNSEVTDEPSISGTVTSSQTGLSTTPCYTLEKTSPLLTHFYAAKALKNAVVTKENLTESATEKIAEQVETDLLSNAKKLTNSLNTQKITEPMDEAQFSNELSLSSTKSCAKDNLCASVDTKDTPVNNDYLSQNLSTSFSPNTATSSDCQTAVEGATDEQHVKNDQLQSNEVDGSLSGIAATELKPCNAVTKDKQPVNCTNVVNKKLLIDGIKSNAECKVATKNVETAENVNASNSIVIRPNAFVADSNVEEKLYVDGAAGKQVANTNQIATDESTSLSRVLSTVGYSSNESQNRNAEADKELRLSNTSQLNDTVDFECNESSGTFTKHDKVGSECNKNFSINSNNGKSCSQIEIEKSSKNVCDTINDKKVDRLLENSNSSLSSSRISSLSSSRISPIPEVEGTENDLGLWEAALDNNLLKGSTNNSDSSTSSLVKDFFSKGERSSDSDDPLGDVIASRPVCTGNISTGEDNDVFHGDSPSDMEISTCSDGENFGYLTDENKSSDTIISDRTPQIPVVVSWKTATQSPYKMPPLASGRANGVLPQPWAYTGRSINSEVLPTVPLGSATVSNRNVIPSSSSRPVGLSEKLDELFSTLLQESAYNDNRPVSPMQSTSSHFSFGAQHLTMPTSDRPTWGNFQVSQIGLQSLQRLTSAASLREMSETATTSNRISPKSDFVSDDPNENKDNCNPNWNILRRLETDDERYHAVRVRWRNIMIPDPSVDLTSQKYRQRLEGNSYLPTNRKRPASDTSLQNEAKRRKREVPCTETLDSQLDLLVAEFDNRKRKAIDVFHRHHSHLERELIRFEHRRGRYANRYECEREEKRYRFVCDTLADLEDSHRRKLEEIKHEFQIATEKVETAREEVLTFHAFYANLKNSANENEDTTKLMKTVQEEMSECYSIYRLYNKYYS